MTKPTPEMITKWKHIYEQYKNKLYPNKKTAVELVGYLKQKYQLVEMHNENLNYVIKGNAAHNPLYPENLSKEDMLKPQGFFVEDTGLGKMLYENQDEIFKGNKIIIGIECETDFFMVEGSSLLYDELIAFQGLEERGLANYFVVAQYISCLQKFNMLDTIIIE